VKLPRFQRERARECPPVPYRLSLVMKGSSVRVRASALQDLQEFSAFAILLPAPSRRACEHRANISTRGRPRSDTVPDQLPTADTSGRVPPPWAMEIVARSCATRIGRNCS
jgi:hypothetical protein